MQRPILAIAMLGLGAIGLAAWDARGWPMLALALVGGLAGVALYHASFGFTAAWRRMWRERRGAGLRAQMLLIGLTCLVSYPLIAGMEGVSGNVLPMGVASAFGALVFGIGMQLGGGCASGTLFTAGGGSTRMILVLAFFIGGSLLASWHWPFWTARPTEPDAFREFLTWRMGPVSVINRYGPWLALALILTFAAAVWLGSLWIERRAHGGLEPLRATGSVLTGPWSLALGAAALAVVGILTLVIGGRPWGVTWGFALWGAQIADATGVNVASWDYWSGWRAAPLEAGPFADRTSVMNFGIIFGAMAAAALAGRYHPQLKLSARDIATAVIGGILMGYGARLAYGCNIGAYLGGLVSGSLHGFWWLIWGFLGSIIGTWLRGRLAMDPPLVARATASS